MKEVLDIIRYGSNGEGVALQNGKVIFVPYALVGESVECEICSINKSFCKSKLLSITKPSKNRAEVKCPYFYNCGGCSLLHMKYDEQLFVKQQIVKNNLKKYADIDYDVKPVFASDNQYNYRNHITFAVNPKGELGFFENLSHNVLKIKKCNIANENINKCIDIFNTYFFDSKLKGYNYQSKKGEIKQVDIKFLNNQLLITIVATINELPNLENLKVRLNCLGLKYGVYLSVNKKDNTLVYGEKLKHLFGIKQIENIEHNLNTFVSSYSFIQINNYIKEQIYNSIADFISADVVLDAYCGRGVLSCILSKNAKRVVGIEIMQSAINDANKLLEINNITNVEFICGDCEKVLNDINENFDCIVIDPPRKGVSENVLNKILELLPKKIVYLSCASNTLARDLKILMQSNLYKIVKIQPYDMFANTPNIETLVFLERLNAEK